jgi:hypothetical protein
VGLAKNSFFRILKNPDFGFRLMKNSYNDGKISENFMEIYLINCSGFCYWNIAETPQILNDSLDSFSNLNPKRLDT